MTNTKPKRGTFDIAIRGGRRETETGYLLGGFATRAPRRGEFFWQFTHLETGTKVNVYPPHEDKASALAHLAKLADGTAPQCEALAQTFARYGRAWGLGAGTVSDPKTTSRKQPPGFTADGWHCWTGPSGTRYANVGTGPSVVGVVSGHSDLFGVPLRVVQWLRPEES